MTNWFSLGYRGKEVEEKARELKRGRRAMTHQDPANAPERTVLPRRNFVKCITNEITDMPLRLKEASGVPAGDYVDFWKIEYECLDVVYSDGNPLVTGFGSKLYNKDGDMMDNTQRPAVCSQAFAGLGLVGFPDSPDYDEEEIVGQCFVVEGTQFFPPTSRLVPVPVEVLGKDFTYGGEVRTLPAQGEGVNPAQVQASAVKTVEITDSPELRKQIAEALGGMDVTDNTAILQALQPIGPGKTLGGASFFGLAAGKSGVILSLIDAGIIAIINDLIKAAE